MSYRAFKRLLGETSLERKCRFLFGAATLLLIWASFTWYARQTEDLAYEQITATGRLLVNPLIVKAHQDLLVSATDEKAADKPKTQRQERLQRALDELSEEHLPESLRKYKHRLMKP